MASKRIALLMAITVLLIASTIVPALALLPNGQSAPDFQLKDLSGNSHKLSDFRGKVVVIDFFGWACSACIDDAKTNLVPLYNTYYKNDAKVQFISVEVNNGSSAEIQQYLQETGVPWLVLSGGSSLVSTYNIASTPSLYVINPAGNVALSKEYPTNVQTLKSTIDSLESSTTPVASAPATCAQSATSLDLFAKGADNALYWKHWRGTTWSTSTSLGGNLTSEPAATSPANGLIDVFARGTDGALWSKNTTNGGASWSSWHSLGGQLASGAGPAADAQNVNSLDVFVQGTDHALWHKSLQGSAWSAWGSLGGNLTSSPAATSPANGLIDVFARGSDNGLWQKTYNNGWSGWTSVGAM
jgi:peroxiredoxin